MRDSDIYQAQYNIDIVARGEGKKIVVLCAHTIGDNRYVTKEQIHIKAETGVDVEIIVMQNENGLSEHNSEYDIVVESEAKIKLNIITLFGGKLNNKISSLLKGEGGECSLYCIKCLFPRTCCHL